MDKCFLNIKARQHMYVRICRIINRISRLFQMAEISKRILRVPMIFFCLFFFVISGLGVF